MLIKCENFTLKLENGRVFKTIIETLATIIDEVKFIIDAEKLQIKTMDPSRIYAFQLTLLSKYFFDEYQYDSKRKKCEICLNLEDFDKILQCSNSDDSIELSFQEGAQKIEIKMQREGSLSSKKFSLNLIEDTFVLAPMDKLLKIKYDVIWSMDPNILIEAIKCAEIYCEIIDKNKVLGIEITEEKLTMWSSEMIKGMGFDYELFIEDLIETDISGRNIGAFSIEFLKMIMKIEPIIEKLEISLKTDIPLKMIFNLLDGGILEYFLAPRVKEVEWEEDE